MGVFERFAAPPPTRQVKVGIGSAVVLGFGFGIGVFFASHIMGALSKAILVRGPQTSQSTIKLSNLGSNDVCDVQIKAFQECVNNHGTDIIGKCRTQMEMLSQCRRGSSSTNKAQVATTSDVPESGETQ